MNTPYRATNASVAKIVTLFGSSKPPTAKKPIAPNAKKCRTLSSPMEKNTLVELAAPIWGKTEATATMQTHTPNKNRHRKTLRSKIPVNVTALANVYFLPAFALVHPPCVFPAILSPTVFAIHFFLFAFASLRLCVNLSIAAALLLFLIAAALLLFLIAAALLLFLIAAALLLFLIAAALLLFLIAAALLLFLIAAALLLFLIAAALLLFLIAAALLLFLIAAALLLFLIAAALLLFLIAAALLLFLIAAALLLFLIAAALLLFLIAAALLLFLIAAALLLFLIAAALR